MDTFLEALGRVFNAAFSVLIPSARRARLRSGIREDLKLLTDLEGRDPFRAGTATYDAVVERIKSDVARLSRVRPEGSRPKVDPGTVVVGALLSASFSYWTWRIAHHAHEAGHGLQWYGWLIGVLAGIFAIGTIGQFVFPSSAP